MPTTSLFGLFIVTAVAFFVPFLLGMSPINRLPAVVLEIVAGIIIGPSVLGLVHYDLPIQLLSLLGLAFLLFHAGLEVDLERLKGPVLTLVSLGFLLTLGLALPIGYWFYTFGQVKSPLFITIILSATTLGMVTPLIKDAGESASDFGQLVIAGSLIADFVPIVLMSLFFANESTSVTSKIMLLVGFILFAIVLTFAIFGLKRLGRVLQVFERLQNTTAQIRVRAAFMLLMGFSALAGIFGMEAILGAFLAGAILKLIDTDKTISHPQFRQKLDAIGFGIFIPIFFVSTGIRFNFAVLLTNRTAMLCLLLFFLSLLLVRGIPALLYRRRVGNRLALGAGFLQATSLPFIVSASHVGVQLGIITLATGAALVATGLLSALIFPLAALSVLNIRRPAASLLDEPA